MVTLIAVLLQFVFSFLTNFSLLFPAFACHPLCLFPLLSKLPCACLTSCTFRKSVAYRPGRDTPKPQFISEFSVKASRHSTESWRDLPSRNPASSSDRAEPRRSVLTLCTHGRPHGILQGSSVKYQPAHLGQAMIEAQLLLCHALLSHITARSTIPTCPATKMSCVALESAFLVLPKCVKILQLSVLPC